MNNKVAAFTVWEKSSNTGKFAALSKTISNKNRNWKVKWPNIKQTQGSTHKHSHQPVSNTNEHASISCWYMHMYDQGGILWNYYYTNFKSARHFLFIYSSYNNTSMCRFPISIQKRIRFADGQIVPYTLCWLGFMSTACISLDNHTNYVVEI